MVDRSPRTRPAPTSHLSRRGFLLGAAASGLLVACGSSDDETTAAGSSTTGEPGDALPEGVVGGLSAVRFFGPYFSVGAPARVPFGISDDEGVLSESLAPEEVTVRVVAPDGAVAAEGLTSPLYSGGLPRPYYAIEFTPEHAGFYDLQIDAGPGGEVVTQLQVVEADDPAVAAMIGPGDEMPALLTPTVDDPRGVTPICTREPDCELHSRTVADVLDAGEPFALLVATPAFCQTTICGPVLDVLLSVLPGVNGVTAVHAEVYADPANNEVPPTPEDFAPVVSDLGLAFEPVLFTVGSDGVVRERLDYIFGQDEVRAALDRLVG